MSDDKKKPVAPRQEILPPEKKNPSPFKPHNPDGVIDAAVSGFVARAKARSIDANNRMREAQLRNIKLTTENIIALGHQMRAWAELADIDAIIDGDRRQREFSALIARVTRENEITRLEHETAELEMKTEELKQKKRRQAQEIDRENQRAASLDAEERWKNKTAEEDARNQFAMAERNRVMNETISAVIIETRHEIEKATAAEAKYKLLRVLGVLQRMQGQPKQRSSDPEVLKKLIAKFKNRQNLASVRHDHTEAGLYNIIIGELEAQLDEINGSSGEEP